MTFRYSARRTWKLRNYKNVMEEPLVVIFGSTGTGKSDV